MSGSMMASMQVKTVMHCHVHIIPRRRGDAKNPRGGVRGVIQEKQNY
jgi:ATP adenylyltransferase